MKLFGIPFRFHWTWWCFVAFFIFGDVIALDYKEVIWDLFILTAAAGLITGHELSHALTARRFGYETKQIMLHLLGGVAVLDLNKTTSREEFWIALAGPAFNFVLGTAALLLGILNPFNIFWIPDQDENIIWSFWGRGIFFFTLINFSMAFFNLIPAYPMDGGRILRSLFKDKHSALAQNVSNVVSVICAFGFIAWGITVFNPLMIMLATIILLGVWAERTHQVKL